MFNLSVCVQENGIVDLVRVDGLVIREVDYGRVDMMFEDEILMRFESLKDAIVAAEKMPWLPVS